MQAHSGWKLMGLILANGGDLPNLPKLNPSKITCYNNGDSSRDLFGLFLHVLSLHSFKTLFMVHKIYGFSYVFQVVYNYF